MSLIRSTAISTRLTTRITSAKQGFSLAPVASAARLDSDIQLGGNFLQLFDKFLVLHFVARMTNYPAAQF